MKLPRRKFLHLAAGAAALPAASRIARAQAYPTRPVRVIVPFPPAGSSDILARLIGPWLSDRLGQPFVIENRPGAATNIGAHVPYRGGGSAITDLLGGQVQVFFSGLGTSIEYIGTGKIRALAVTTAVRLEALPDVPNLGRFRTWL